MGGDIEDILTDEEKSFLSRHGYTPADVMDVRWMSSADWKREIRKQEKNIALGTRCQKKGHRLRTRAGHCCQCDPKKLSFQERYDATQYVYIAGSAAQKFLKVGTCKDILQRERQMRAESYGGASDWELLMWVFCKNAGQVEHNTRSWFSSYFLVRHYYKDGELQAAREILRCQFSRVREKLLAESEGLRSSKLYEADFALGYEFDAP